VRTLQGAHEALRREWPGRDAPVAAWLAYHERAAALYRAVADTDQAHHHEALAFAQFATDAAQSIANETGIGAGAGVERPARPDTSATRH
jgi:hypothetical protein